MRAGDWEGEREEVIDLGFELALLVVEKTAAASITLATRSLGFIPEASAKTLFACIHAIAEPAALRHAGIHGGEGSPSGRRDTGKGATKEEEEEEEEGDSRTPSSSSVPDA